jgi:DNA-binding NtrC family response regulator
MTTGVTMTAARVSAPFEGAFDVRVTEGPDRGKHLRIDDASSPRLYVGRSSTCDLRLDDPHVSSRHLALELHGDELVAIDLGSRNRTSFGGVLGKEVVLLGHGERMVLGDTTLVVERKAEPRATPLAPRNSFGKLRGESREMRRVYPLLEKLAASSVPVLIEGETGTGKEILAESLHEQGPRAKRPFVVLDCTSVAPSVLESELFGHEKGAFTGAAGMRAGVFEEADGGTLFIDEIGDLELPMQAKLLRAVERGEVRRVGSSKSIRIDARILCATRRDLDAMVQNGLFRDDLYHRLAVARVELPPLRRRVGDIVPLVELFCRESGRDPSSLPMSLVARWETQAWPGNVRELRNAVLRYLELGELAEWKARAAPTLDTPRADEADASSDLGLAIRGVLAKGIPFAAARDEVMETFEREFLEIVIQKTGGNLTKAAAEGGFSRRHLHRLLQKRRG